MLVLYHLSDKVCSYIMTKRFIKTIEDFACEHCNKEIKGTGYTNHCPSCLWSKHVDINPGDRASSCGGMMEPISVEEKGGEYSIVHRCQKCGYQKKNKAAKEDDFGEIIKLSKLFPKNHL